MPYEQKIEPITRTEVLLGGITLQLWILFVNTAPWLVGDQCREEIFDADIKSQYDMANVHHCLKNNKSRILGATCFLLLGFPIAIAHLYYIKRFFETMLSFLNAGMTVYLYQISWFINALTWSVIGPSLAIFTCYYDWEFAFGREHEGYAIQYQFAHFMLIIFDSAMIPLGIAGV